MTLQPGDKLPRGTPFLCPFCGEKCEAVPPPFYGVIHELPPCPFFLELDPDQFLRAVNEMKRREN